MICKKKKDHNDQQYFFISIILMALRVSLFKVPHPKWKYKTNFRISSLVRILRDKQRLFGVSVPWGEFSIKYFSEFYKKNN